MPGRLAVLSRGGTSPAIRPRVGHDRHPRLAGPVGHQRVAPLLDIDAEQLTGRDLLVAAHRLAAGPVQVRGWLIWHRTSTWCTVEGASVTRSAVATGPVRCFQRKSTIRAAPAPASAADCDAGGWTGSAIAAGPSQRYRSAQRLAVAQDFDPAFLAHPDLAEFVFVLGLEVQRRRVVVDQGPLPAAVLAVWS